MSARSVSVVIPTYNRAHLVGRAVASAAAQTIIPLEIIVVDDGSTDDTRERFGSQSDEVIYVHQANQGVSAARNLGIRQARGEFIAFLDSDDAWHPRKLELQLEVFRRRPDIGLLGALPMASPDPPDLGGDEDLCGRLELFSWSQIAIKNRLGTSSVMARADVIRQAGGFDPALKGSEERDLWLRIAELSSVAVLRLPLVGWGVPPGSLSADAEKCRAGMLRTLLKLDERGAWRGQRRLRRISYACLYHSLSYVYMQNRSYARAMGSVLRSVAWYPLPLSRDEVETRFARPKRLVVSGLRMLRLAGEDPAAYRAASAEAGRVSCGTE